MDTSPAQLKQVLKSAHKALKSRPRDSALHNMVAPLYERLGQYGDAAPHLAFLVAHTPVADEILYARYIYALLRSGSFLKAQQAVDEGLRHHSTSILLLKNKALNYLLMCDFQNAQETYAEIHELDSSDRHSVGMSGSLKFLMTDMKEGYEEYARRPLDEALSRCFDGIARWEGQPVAGKRIVLRSEQGIGDAVMFLGLFPWLFAQNVVASMVVTEKMAPLMSRSFPGVPVISEDGLKGMGKEFDYYVPLGDLLQFVLPHHTPADHPAYLVPDRERADRLREQYLGYAKERGRTRLIGLSWHTTNPEVGFTRNISLEELHPLLSVAGVQFVSLQYGDHSEEIADSNRRIMDIVYQDAGVDAFNDVDGLAAQMAAMDEIITIDNATVHMAGALGIPTTLLLSTMPDWRWGLTGSTCRWYRSVHLERQEAIFRWQPIVKRVCLRVKDSLAEP